MVVCTEDVVRSLRAFSKQPSTSSQTGNFGAIAGQPSPVAVPFFPFPLLYFPSIDPFSIHAFTLPLPLAGPDWGSASWVDRSIYCRSRSDAAICVAFLIFQFLSRRSPPFLPNLRCRTSGGSRISVLLYQRRHLVLEVSPRGRHKVVGTNLLPDTNDGGDRVGNSVNVDGAGPSFADVVSGILCTSLPEESIEAFEESESAVSTSANGGDAEATRQGFIPPSPNPVTQRPPTMVEDTLAYIQDAQAPAGNNEHHRRSVNDQIALPLENARARDNVAFWQQRSSIHQRLGDQ
ncbi:hypothetical protein RHGRI_017895 [Rhododendron griersonianum]|uniref:Uncharacterized protein n=1 Tax=Rhododendron griersonianum TaxID=479676 RepID=A0AAV6JZD7_9ERIC|nr:hypothetical protein RHGRI_017895 [Rhododendron griersonianum]